MLCLEREGLGFFCTGIFLLHAQQQALLKLLTQMQIHLASKFGWKQYLLLHKSMWGHDSHQVSSACPQATHMDDNFSSV